jgi:tRNA threonylcarbamoyladenosine biosynthesis protein TsaE
VHLDLYRLELPAAADELFAQEEEEAVALGALMAVEWPGRLSFVPEGAWRLELRLAEAADPQAGRLALIEPGA